jgi:GTPase SAR1 family protein
LVYDVTDIDSFNALEEWIEEINQHANEQITLILVANKSDLKENRKVSTEQGSNFA